MQELLQDLEEICDPIYRRYQTNGCTPEKVDEMRTIKLTETKKNIFNQSAHRLVYDDELHAPITSSQLLEE